MALCHSDSVSVLILSLFSLILLFLADKTHQKAPIQCGKPNPLVNEFPWMAHLLIQNPSGKTFSCGGTLISDQHIITAAHCVVEDGTDKLFTIVNITLGSVDVNRAARHHQMVSWKVLAIPEINANLLEHDIAVIILAKPAILNDYVQPACLPFAHDSDQVNDSVIFTGWGQQSTGVHQCCLRESSSVLRRWNTTVISSFGYDGQCQQTAAVGPFSGHNVICTDGSQQQRRFCYGDGGGPLNYYNTKLDRWFVIGIAGRGNLGNNCHRIKNNNNNLNRPNILTRVRSQLEFIRDHSGVVPPIKSPTGMKKKRKRIFPTLPDPSISSTTTTLKPFKMTAGPAAADEMRPLMSEMGEFSCKGKSSGNYPTSNCSPNFFMCSQFNYHTFTCSRGLVYRPSINACDWPSNVPGCIDSN